MKFSKKDFSSFATLVNKLSILGIYLGSKVRYSFLLYTVLYK